MDKDKLYFFLNLVAITLLTIFLFEYLFPSSESLPNTDSRAPKELAIDKTHLSLVNYELPLQKLAFDENTGNLEIISLKNYIDSHGDEVSTLFEKKDDNTGYQSLRCGLIAKDFSSGQTTELAFTDVKFLNDSGVFTIKRYNTDFDLTYIQKFIPQDDYKFMMEDTVLTGYSGQLEIYSFKQLENTGKSYQPGTIPGFGMFQGASFHTSNSNYNKIPFSKLYKKKFNEKADSGWFAFSQRYFVTALKTTDAGTFYSKYLSDFDESIAGFISSGDILDSNTPIVRTYSFYSGPEQIEHLQDFDPYLDKVIDYGFLWPIAKMFFYLLTLIHQVIHNWGLAIIAATITLKFIFLPFSIKATRATNRAKSMQPQLEELKNRYKDDQQAYYQAVSKFYSEHKINPLSGIVPMLVQVPFFIAFYTVLMESIELRGAPFYGWITDLSVQDPYYILPILMGGVMALQQMTMPKPDDETFAMFFRIMPLLMTLFFLQLPSGLVLYVLTNTVFSVLQTGLIKSAPARDSTA